MGDYIVTFTVDGDSATGTASTPPPMVVARNPTRVIDVEPLQVTTTSPLPAATVGATYSLQLVADGGFRPYTWVVYSGTLPAGLSLTSEGVLAGTPTVAGLKTFEAKVTDVHAANARSNMSVLVVAGPSLPNPDYGSDYRDWMKQPTGVGTPAYNNGGILYTPSRTYHGGLVDCVAHPEYLHPYDPSLPNNGWLTLMPWDTPTTNADGSITTGVLYDASLTAGGAALLDQANGGALVFGGPQDDKGVGDFRTMIVGVQTVRGAGLQTFGSRRIKMAWCQSSYPAEDWAADYDTVATALGLATGYPRSNSTVLEDHMKGGSVGYLMRHNYAPWRSQYVTLIACDANNVADDLYHAVSCRNIHLYGCKGWWDDTKGVADFHGDTFQVEGGESGAAGEWDIYLDYCLMGGHMQVFAEHGDIGTVSLRGFEAHHIWQCDSYTSGMSVGGVPPHGFYNSGIAQGGGYLPDYDEAGDYWRWFGNGRDDNGDSGEYISTSPNWPVLGTFPRTETHQWPAGVSPNSTHPPTGGRIPDRPQMPSVVGHVDNPANRFRSHHPYDQLFSFIATYSASDPMLGFN